ncbi:MAG: class I SAM-dependent methyltransferase [Methylacidiphilales bacterium]|nr:class I SAM-dependent methyltransferase [Candidatus Methylacidiphilales bacterium]
MATLVITEVQTAQVSELEAGLIRYYNTTTDYPAFMTVSEHASLWGEVTKAAREVIGRKGGCRILEVGAGRSGFGAYLRSQSSQGMHLTSQDITRTNVEFLQRHSDEVLHDNLDKLPGSWDVIFHSYVYEHLCRPSRFITCLWQVLNSGGYLLIQSPRYDFPFYLPPSLSHLTARRRWEMRFYFLLRDLGSLLTGQRQFLLISDPAIFHQPFHRDRDAIHRVRRADLVHLLGKEAIVRNFPLPAGGFKDWLLKRFLTLRVVIQKKPDHTSQTLVHDVGSQ